MKRKIVLGLVEVISHIFIFFYLKSQVIKIDVDWWVLLGLGTIIYLSYEELTKFISDDSRKTFIQGILVTAATVMFFVSLQSYFSMDLLTNNSYIMLIVGVVAYIMREPITDWVVGIGK